jgi:hypothetical protein
VGGSPGNKRGLLIRSSGHLRVRVHNPYVVRKTVPASLFSPNLFGYYPRDSAKVEQGKKLRIPLIASALSKSAKPLRSARVGKATTEEIASYHAPRFLRQRVTDSGGGPNENVGVSPTTRDLVRTQKLTFFYGAELPGRRGPSPNSLIFLFH